MPLQLERLSAERISTLPTQQTVFFFPVGGLEDHGPHLPIGMDLFEARKLCELAAQKLESEMPGWVAVLMPDAAMGVDLNTSASAISVRAHVLRDWLVDSCVALHRMGFYRFVCFSGTVGPKQITAIEEASRLIRQRALGSGLRKWTTRWSDRPVLISAASCWITRKEVMKSPFSPDPTEHGGARDTGYGLWIAPDLVSPDWATMPTQPKITPRWKRQWMRARHRLTGFWGDPKGAAPESARHEVDMRLAEVFPKFRAIWEGANPEMIARSWYSVFPPNKSFFRAWLLFAGLMVLMSVWVYMSFRAMVGD